MVALNSILVGSKGSTLDTRDNHIFGAQGARVGDADEWAIDTWLTHIVGSIYIQI